MGSSRIRRSSRSRAAARAHGVVARAAAAPPQRARVREPRRGLAAARGGLVLGPRGEVHVDEVLSRALVREPDAIEWTEADDLASQPVNGVPFTESGQTTH